MDETQSIDERVAELDRDLPTLENQILEIEHGDALEYFDPPEIVAAYAREIERRIAAGTYLPADD